MPLLSLLVLALDLRLLKSDLDCLKPQSLHFFKLNNIQSDRNFHNFIRIIIGESGRFPELAKAYVNNIAKPAIETLTQYFKSHPELKLEDPEATVRVMVGSLVYFVMLQEMLHGKDILPLEGDRLIDILTDLITKHQS